MKNRILKLILRALGQSGHIDGLSHAAALKAEGRIIMGEYCSISPRAVITDPDYVRMGDNARLSDCFLFGHDGSINMVNRMMNTAFDAVGKIIIGNNVFIGHGAIVLPDTTIGDDTIIGAGSVLKGNIEGGYVYAGSPLRRIRPMPQHVLSLSRRDQQLPEEWRAMIRERGREFDSAMEPRLVELRRRHFFSADLTA